MKTVRLFFKKQGLSRYISHLDTMRAMTRLIRRAELPVWYTEGFNPHLYITFAFPLSLGFESTYELADIRLTDDSYPIDNICGLLNENAPDGFVFFDAKEPVKKLSELAFAKFEITFEDGGFLKQELEAFLSQKEITVEKKTKKGILKSINVAPDIKDFSLKTEENTVLEIILPAGPVKTLNPELITDKFFCERSDKPYMKISRTCLFDSQLKPLK